MLYLNSIFSNYEYYNELRKLNKAMMATKEWQYYAKERIRKGLSVQLWSPNFLCDQFIKLCIQNGCMAENDFGLIDVKSKEYFADNMHGICEDGDKSCVRYVKENGKTYKMRAGKLFRKWAEEYGNYKSLFSEAILNFVCEEFQRQWEDYAAQRMEELGLAEDDPRYVLHVDDRFDKIYSSSYCYGDFGSCMEDKDRHSFYEDSVTAKATYLTDSENNDRIVARAILFTEVEDCDTGEHLRLCERQYSSNGDERLKRTLVKKLIKGGFIDGYKKVGAGCHDAHAFVSNKGEDWSERDFKIECNLDMADILSYQDSFKYYNEGRGVAYNDDSYRYDYDLATTDRTLNGDCEEWDDYYEEYCNEVLEAWAGQYYDVDAERLNDSDEWVWSDVDDIWVKKEYANYIDGYGWVRSDNEDFCECEECGELCHKDDMYYSEVTEEYYCCERCRDEAEEYYKESNWYYSEITEEYYEDEDELKQAEQEYKEENWYYSEITEEYYEYSDELEAAEREVYEQAYTYAV